MNLEQLSAQMPHPLLPVYLLLQQQRPEQPGPLPQPPPMPVLDDGPHLAVDPLAHQCDDMTFFLGQPGHDALLRVVSCFRF